MNTTHTILQKLLLLIIIIIMSHIEFVFTSLSALSESGTFYTVVQLSGQKLKISPNAIFGDYPCERILNNKY